MTTYKVIGTRPVRPDGIDKVTGGRYSKHISSASSTVSGILDRSKPGSASAAPPTESSDVTGVPESGDVTSGDVSASSDGTGSSEPTYAPDPTDSATTDS